MLDDRMRLPRAAGTCVRAAWLVLGSLTVQLHDEVAGYYITSLDLGSPDVRAVTNNRPDWHGLDDRTQWMGGRVVTIDITALESVNPNTLIDQIAASFAPFMVPTARPVLHYVLDRPGAPERMLTLRPQAYAFKIDDAFQRDIQLAFVAADPVAYDATVKTPTAIIGTPVTFIYNGDVPARPVIRINGPLTNPLVNMFIASTSAVSGRIAMVAGYVLAAAHYIEADCAARTITLDGTSSLLASVNWTNVNNGGGWPTLIPGVAGMRMGLGGTANTAPTNAICTYSDGYLV